MTVLHRDIGDGGTSRFATASLVEWRETVKDEITGVDEAITAHGVPPRLVPTAGLR